MINELDYKLWLVNDVTCLPIDYKIFLLLVYNVLISNVRISSVRLYSKNAND